MEGSWEDVIVLCQEGRYNTIFSLSFHHSFFRQNALKSRFWLTIIVLVLFPGGEEIISLERDLQGLFERKTQCRKFDLVESLPHPSSGQGIAATHEFPAGAIGATGDGAGGDDESDFQDIVVTATSQKDPTLLGLQGSFVVSKALHCYGSLCRWSVH